MNPKDLAYKIANDTGREFRIKFMKGQKEHGGDFAVKPTVTNIREEVLDLVAYSHNLEQHKQKLIGELINLHDYLLYECGDTSTDRAFKRILDQLTTSINLAKDL